MKEIVGPSFIYWALFYPFGESFEVGSSVGVEFEILGSASPAVCDVGSFPPSGRGVEMPST